MKTLVVALEHPKSWRPKPTSCGYMRLSLPGAGTLSLCRRGAERAFGKVEVGKTQYFTVVLVPMEAPAKKKKSPR